MKKQQPPEHTTLRQFLSTIPSDNLLIPDKGKTKKECPETISEWTSNNNKKHQSRQKEQKWERKADSVHKNEIVIVLLKVWHKHRIRWDGCHLAKPCFEPAWCSHASQTWEHDHYSKHLFAQWQLIIHKIRNIYGQIFPKICLLFKFKICKVSSKCIITHEMHALLDCCSSGSPRGDPGLTHKTPFLITISDSHY